MPPAPPTLVTPLDDRRRPFRVIAQTTSMGNPKPPVMASPGGTPGAHPKAAQPGPRLRPGVRRLTFGEGRTADATAFAMVFDLVEQAGDELTTGQVALGAEPIKALQVAA